VSEGDNKTKKPSSSHTHTHTHRGIQTNIDIQNMHTSTHTHTHTHVHSTDCYQLISARSCRGKPYWHCNDSLFLFEWRRQSSKRVTLIQLWTHREKSQVAHGGNAALKKCCSYGLLCANWPSLPTDGLDVWIAHVMWDLTWHGNNGSVSAQWEGGLHQLLFYQLNVGSPPVPLLSLRIKISPF